MTKAIRITAPELGAGIATATVACWHKAVGDSVSEEEDITELVTDKAVFNVPAGVCGTLKEICVAAGREIRIGDTLAVVEPYHD